MNSSRFRLISAVHLVLIHDERVLLLRRFNTGYEDGNYSVPAGHLDGGEAVTTAMAREALEETGIHLSPTDLRVAHVMHRRVTEADGAAHERIDFFLTAPRWTGTPRIMEPHKCDEVAWYPIGDLPHNTIEYVHAGLVACQREEVYSEFGWQRSMDFQAVPA